MVEVFKTNVQCLEDARRVLQKLAVHFPEHRINFDLTDCDNILRVEGENILPCTIISLLGDSAYECTVLE